MTAHGGEKRQRQNLVGVRLTDDEYALLLTLAARLGVPPPSALRYTLAGYGKVVARAESAAGTTAGRVELLRAAHAELTRLSRAGLPVPYLVRSLDCEYRAHMRRQKIAATEAADAA